MMTIQFDDDLVKKATAEALLLSLTPEKREEIMRAAILELFKKERNRVTGQEEESLVGMIFRNAVTQTATQQAKELLAPGTELGEKLRAEMKKVMDRLFLSEERLEKVAAATADKLSDVLTREAWQ